MTSFDNLMTRLHALVDELNACPDFDPGESISIHLPRAAFRRIWSEAKRAATYPVTVTRYGGGMILAGRFVIMPSGTDREPRVTTG